MNDKATYMWLADKRNKDQLKKYPPEDGLINEAETCRGELIKVVA
jgi:hypothetical protein